MSGALHHRCKFLTPPAGYKPVVGLYLSIGAIGSLLPNLTGTDISQHPFPLLFWYKPYKNVVYTILRKATLRVLNSRPVQVNAIFRSTFAYSQLLKPSLADPYATWLASWSKLVARRSSWGVLYAGFCIWPNSNAILGGLAELKWVACLARELHPHGLYLGVLP